MRRAICFLVAVTLVCGSAIASASSVVVVDATITADNAYHFLYGTQLGPPTLVGHVGNCDFASEIFSCSLGPEVYTQISLPAGPDDYVYIVAGNDGGPQGLVAQFVSGDSVGYTGSLAWEVYATGLGVVWCHDPLSLLTIGEEIQKANTNTGQAGSSVGWVGVGGGASGTVGALRVGDYNIYYGTNVIGPACPSMISAHANWIWYSPDTVAVVNPFQSWQPDNWMIFRVPMASLFTRSAPRVGVADPVGLGAKISLRILGNPVLSDDVSMRLSFPEADEVVVDVLDVDGRLVRDVVTGRLDAGEHLVKWDLNDASGCAVPNGIYFVRVRCERKAFASTQKVSIVR